MSNPDTKAPAEYASPACLAHEVDPDYMGLSTNATTNAPVNAAINPVNSPTIEPAPGPARGEPTNSGLVAALRRFLARW
jgi:hypothetical protein